MEQGNLSSKIVLTFTPQALAVIGQALSELPFKVVASVISDIDRQILEQKKAAETPAPPAKAKVDATEPAKVRATEPAKERNRVLDGEA